MKALPGFDPPGVGEFAREILKQYAATDDVFPSRHIPRLRAEAEAKYAEALARHGGRSEP